MEGKKDLEEFGEQCSTIIGDAFAKYKKPIDFIGARAKEAMQARDSQTTNVQEVDDKTNKGMAKEKNPKEKGSKDLESR